MIRLFISYSHKDEAFREELETHLSLLKRQNVIDVWQDRKITAGSEWANQIDKNLEAADVILLLISSDFLASDYCHDMEMQKALELHDSKCAIIIPIIIRAVHWKEAPFARLQALPRNGQPVASWKDRDEAWSEVVEGIYQAIKSLKISHAYVAKPIGFWNIPFARNVFFTGREDVLGKIREVLNASGRAALSALGGMGKTQTAIEYAYRQSDDYAAVLWVKADSREAILSDFAGLAVALNLPEKDAQDQNVVIESVKRWLNNNHDWLLILDNAADLKIAAEFFPKGKNGHVLLTTRAQATGRLATRVEIEKMEQKDGARFLLHRAKILGAQTALEDAADVDQATAKQITQEMDGLPLALDQAGAYIEETGTGLADYLDLYKTYGLRLLKERGGILTDHPDPVATTWLLSFKKIEQANPAAAEVLRFCAFLHPDAIPEELFSEGAQELGPTLKSVAADSFEFNEAIGEILKYSLLWRDPKDKTLQIHRLVQAVVKDGMDKGIQCEWIERIAKALSLVFPNPEFRAWPRCERLLLQVQACAMLVKVWNIESLEVGTLLDKTASYLYDRGLYKVAEPLYQRALAIREQAQGPDHPHVGASLSNLAALYMIQGKYSEAEPLLQRALMIFEKALDPYHPDIATCLNNLAGLYEKRGKYSEAEPFYQRALTIREQILGADHPHVAMSLSNLAALYEKRGKYSEAEPLHKRALMIFEKALDPYHPDIATCLNNLAGLYEKRGKYSEAEPFYQRALRILHSTLGPDHPNTIQGEKNYRALLEKMIEGTVE